jgi:hypothetical protein
MKLDSEQVLQTLVGKTDSDLLKALCAVSDLDSILDIEGNVRLQQYFGSRRHLDNVQVQLCEPSSLC